MFSTQNDVYLPDDDTIERVLNSDRLHILKHESLALSEALQNSGNRLVLRLADRMDRCTSFRQHRLFKQRGAASWTCQSDIVHHCKLAYCPICGSNRSYSWSRRFESMVPLVRENYNACKFLLFTISSKNCDVSALGREITKIKAAWRKITKRKRFKAVMGWIRSIEVTTGGLEDSTWTSGAAHPHIHALLCVPANFKADRNAENEWGSIWREVMDLDYEPTFHIESVKRSPNKYDDALRVVRYITKPIRLIDAEPSWAHEYVLQTRGERLISSGGIFRGVAIESESTCQEPQHGSGEYMVRSIWSKDTDRWEVDSIL